MCNSGEENNISAVILAGGLGTRLKPVVHDRPKILAEISGRPYITYLFDQLISSGISDVLLCTGHMADLVRETLGNTYRSIRISYSQEPVPLGTGGALRNALPSITTDPVIVMNGDSYADSDLKEYVRWFFQEERDAAILMAYVPDASRYGKVLVSKDGRLLTFEEKTTGSKPGWINAGVYILKKNQISLIPEKRIFSLEKEFFPTLIGKNFYGFSCTGAFIDIGTPASYHQAEFFFCDILQHST